MDEKMMQEIMKTQRMLAQGIGALVQKDLTKTAAQFGTATEFHGDGSLLGSNPVERDVLTTHVRPLSQLSTRLPDRPNNSEHPIFATILGVTDDVGTEPTYPCDDAPQGFWKGCDITAQFGRTVRDTNTINIAQAIKKLNRGDFSDLNLIGQVLGGTNLTPGNLNQGQLLRVQTMSEMINAGIRLERLDSTLIWQGDPANNTAGGGYKEPPGLDQQITTGITDMHTGNTCPGLDSYVDDFNFQLISATTPKSIVQAVSDMEFNLYWNADRMGFLPTQWAFAMKPELWQELTEVWPCQYNTNRCASSAMGSSTVFIDGRENIAARDAMRRSMTIDVNGRSYPVVLDTGINEDTNITNANVPAGQYASGIYMLPLTVTGNFQVLYMEHLDFRMATPDINLLNGVEDFFWTDNGMFLWSVDQRKGGCYELQVVHEWRIVLRTPQLAGRIDNVRYAPGRHLRSPYADSPYFQDGGVSLRPDLTFNAVWL